MKYDYSEYRTGCGCVSPIYEGEGYSSDTVFPISTPIWQSMCLETCIEGLTTCTVLLDGSSICLPNEYIPYIPRPPEISDIPVVSYEIRDTQLFWGDGMGGSWIDGKWTDPNPNRVRSHDTTLGLMHLATAWGFNMYFNQFGDKVVYVSPATAAGFGLDEYGFRQNIPPDRKRTVYWRLVYIYTSSNNIVTRAANTLLFCIPWPEGDAPPDPLEDGIVEPEYFTRRWSLTPCINEAI